jgi:DNA-binding transcriptional MerR regulator
MTPRRKSKHRMERIKPPYCGDAFLGDLITAIDRIYVKGRRKEFRIERDRALIAALFLTGGRLCEVVQLRKSSFDFDNKEARKYNAFLVKEFKLMKHGTWEHRAHVTRMFPIWRDDPLVDYLLKWYHKVDDYLFPSPKKGNPHLSYFHARGLAKKVGEHLPMREYTFPLWFRRQREFYLAEKRGFSISNIKAYMKLKTIQETPTKRNEWQNLLVIAKDFQQKMLPKKSQENVNPLIDLLSIADFLDIDINWMLSVIALQLQEIGIKKLSDKMGIKLDRANIERILKTSIDLSSLKFMPFNTQYKAFSKLVKQEKKIDMPMLVQDMRNTRTNVLHLGYKPTNAETDTIITSLEAFLRS